MQREQLPPPPPKRRPCPPSCRSCEQSQRMAGQHAAVLHGEKSEEVFNSFGLTANDAKNFKTVTEKFGNQFVIKRNTIFERAKFNLRKQEHDETVEAFITALHKLSETCEFGPFRDRPIRDRIVVGIKDTKLSKKIIVKQRSDTGQGRHNG